MEFRGEQDIEIANKLFQFPKLGEQLPDTWNLKLTAEFHMTNDSHLFKQEPRIDRLPLYEGKMIHQFSNQHSEPRYWIDEKNARKALLKKGETDIDQDLDYQRYRLGLRAIARTTDTRTLIATVLQKKCFVWKFASCFHFRTKKWF